MFKFGVGPDDVSPFDPFTVAPGVDQIEAEQPAQAQAEELRQAIFVGILRITDFTIVSGAMKIAVRQFLMNACEFTPRPALLPALSSEAMRQQDENAQRQFGRGERFSSRGGPAHAGPLADD
jgi:hypothetical protein